jgi:hypothetical protein
MATLKIGTRVFHAEDRQVMIETERMFRLTDEQRRYRLDAAKTRLARVIGAEREEVADRRIAHAAATLLSQGIAEI